MKNTFIAICLLIVISCSPAKNPVLYDLVTITTPLGEIIFKLHDETPVHKKSFIKLVEQGYFDEYTFNRVINNFVAQGGCPDTAAGFADSPYLLDPEFNDSLTHIYGAVGAGRDDNPEMLSAGCQFYIVQNSEGLHRLDNKYTIFGQVVKGMDIVDAIVSVETDTLDAPLEPILLKLANFQMDSVSLAELINQ